MKILSLLILGFILAGCGGDGGSGNSSSGDDSPQVTYLLCSHEGDLWLCPDGPGSCIRDQSSVEEGSVAESERQFLIKEVDGKAHFYVKLESGAITIIAECGSNVSFSNSEETDANTTVTTATANFGINQPAEVQ